MTRKQKLETCVGSVLPQAEAEHPPRAHRTWPNAWITLTPLSPLAPILRLRLPTYIWCWSQCLGQCHKALLLSCLLLHPCWALPAPLHCAVLWVSLLVRHTCSTPQRSLWYLCNMFLLVRPSMLCALSAMYRDCADLPGSPISFRGIQIQIWACENMSDPGGP